ncbi:MAG: hypothetical protein HQM12_09600 [SAR324 cluster bacterium]|nr:hypothetical protein [SAR324 cluster bacterium]
MSQFLEQVFSYEKAYVFDKPPSVDRFLWEELSFQLKDLEKRWISLYANQAGIITKGTLSQRESLLMILFRFEEIFRFVRNSTGPRIIHFVCSELYDLIREKFTFNKEMTIEEIDRVAITLAIVNSFLQDEVLEINQMSFEEVSLQLKSVLKPLLEKRFAVDSKSSPEKG